MSCKVSLFLTFSSIQEVRGQQVQRQVRLDDPRLLRRLVSRPLDALSYNPVHHLAAGGRGVDVCDVERAELQEGRATPEVVLEHGPVHAPRHLPKHLLQ